MVFIAQDTLLILLSPSGGSTFNTLGAQYLGIEACVDEYLLRLFSRIIFRDESIFEISGICDAVFGHIQYRCV